MASIQREEIGETVKRMKLIGLLQLIFLLIDILTDSELECLEVSWLNFYFVYFFAL